MKLYHGTSERVARLAMTEGLCPRFESGVESVWEDHPSSEHYVYLTVAYAAYFAMQATEKGERWAIIEIDTDLLPDDGTGCDHLYPDEDFLEQATRNQELPEDWGLNGASMEVRTEWFRANLWRFGHLWEDSIKGLGNCAHGGVIPPEAITRVSFVDPKGIGAMRFMAADPMISLMNYAFCQHKYKALTRWFMGDTVDPADFGHGHYPVLEDSHDLSPQIREQVRPMKQQHDRMRAVLSDHSGVEVRDV